MLDTLKTVSFVFKVTTFRIVICILMLCLILFGTILFCFPGVRKWVTKFRYLLSSFFSIDIGFPGLLRILLPELIVAIGAAFVKGFDSSGGPFHWDTFLWIFFSLLLASFLKNVVQGSIKIKSLLSPGAGHLWRTQRKSATSGIIKAINLNLHKAPLSVDAIRSILTDLLDIIVLHVKDHRGSHDEKVKNVFANILIDSGDTLVVIARDSNCHTKEYERITPYTYSKKGMLCSEAMESKSPKSVGVLTDKYPNGPKNKPYQSALAIPLITSDNEKVYGALSLDCSRPYFFESFTPGVIENSLENSLQPYIQLITLILDSLATRDSTQMLSLMRLPNNVGQKEEGASHG